MNPALGDHLCRASRRTTQIVARVEFPTMMKTAPGEDRPAHGSPGRPVELERPLISGGRSHARSAAAFAAGNLTKPILRFLIELRTETGRDLSAKASALA
jgi:hypothetical protein